MLKLEVPANSNKILLHSCCAPCSGAIIECMVQNGLKPVVYFSNSNIYSREEYELRKKELLRYTSQFGLETVDDEYHHKSWLCCAKGLEKEPERGARCLECFKFRLRRAALYAKNNGLEVLTTTLASSRWKDLEQVNAAGQWACEGTGVLWWPQNWRKGGLQPRRSEIISEQNFYNQTYCGCEFSNTQSVGK